ncbi:C39 family peptidase [Actinocorallia longicatena]|uniref:Peptidase C39-like domain-containing protein n=1 Tax=Actinocorallia longicatena TaxID=111803 RepID=A0ABP6QIX5_9ACTN
MKKVIVAATVPATLLLGLVSSPAHAAAGHNGTVAQPVRTVAATEPVRAKGTPARLNLKIKGIYQKRWWWCSPAVGAISLRTMGINVSQNVLAKKMRSSEAIAGTLDTRAVAVLSTYARKKGYKYTRQNDVHKPARLAARVVHDVGSLRKAVPIQVYMARLPWHRNRVAKDAGHVVLAFGYDKKAKKIRVWDPYDYYGTGGVHDIALNTLAKATQSNGPDRFAGIYYISRI